MDLYRRQQEKGDPSDVIQIFPNYNLQLHCCRHWWLEHWEFKELSFPYWRVYYNTIPGAQIIYKETEYEVSPDKIIMIAPNTSYATRLYDYDIPQNGFYFKGGRINADFPEDKAIAHEYILHLFIHFNLGMPYDYVAPGIYIHNSTPHLNEKISFIKNHLFVEHSKFSFHTRIAIQSLIDDLLLQLPKNNWKSVTSDTRILNVISTIENNLNSPLDNSSLAKIAKMAPNAFSRIFVKEMGVSPQTYVKKKRIDKACVLLHHSSLSIAQIASQTGFADRYHFSRVFKQTTQISPAKYKREFRIS